MYQNIFIDKKTNTVHLWDDQQGYTSFPYPRYAYKKKSGGRYKSIYGDELARVTTFNENDPELFESDLPPETRVLIDAYEDSDEPSTGHNAVFIDIEVDSEGGFPHIEEGDKEITAVSLYDSLTKKYHAYILDKDHLVQNLNLGADVEVYSHDDEETMLMAFLNLWEQLAPTIVTGWNVDFFDMPYLYNRLKRVVGPHNAKRLSPIGACYMRKGLQKLVVGGVSVMDYILLYKKYSGRNMPNHQLNTVGKIVVKMEKVHYDGNLTDLFHNDVKKYLEYNLQDVRIVVALDEKLKFIDLARRICHTGHVPYEWFHMSSRYLDGAIILYIRRNGGLIAPNKPVGGREQYMENEYGSGDDDDSEETFSGAYVKKPIPGRYSWVYDLDLTSMYPNIIISLNISPETKAGKCFKVTYKPEAVEKKRKEILKENADNDKPIREAAKLEEHVARKLKEFDMEYHVRGDVKSYDLGQIEYTREELEDLIKKSNYSLSSNGVLYAQDARGIIPEILTKWFGERVDMRKKAKTCLKSSDQEGYFFYDQMQKVWKILLNSMYGVLGLPIFRFYDVDNAEAVTKTGVTIIKTTAKAINMYYSKVLGKDGDWVIYTDTDSCFVEAAPMIQNKFPTIDMQNEKDMTDAILKVADEVQTYVNSFYDTMALKLFHLLNKQFKLKRHDALVDTAHTFEAKQEVIAKTAFWIVKKRYAQWIIHKEGVLLAEPELEVKGIDVVRTNFPAKFREFMKAFLIDLLNNVAREKIDENILKFVEDIPNLDILDIAKNTSCKFVSQKGDIHYYPKDRQPFTIVTGTPAQVKAGIAYNDLLKKWGLSKKVEPIHHSQKIKWVYLKENEFGINGLAMKADGTDPKQIMDFVTTYIDRKALYEKELKGKLEAFYEVMKWDYPTEETKKAAEFFSF
jgi:DNA polymerase elongation subunit (family B)